MDRVEQARRLAALRGELAQRELAAFVVPRADEHQHSYLPAASERLAWISGFTGSWGTAVIGRDRAALFVDGRYTLQARDEAPDWEHHHLVTAPPETWLGRMLGAGDCVGYDPRVHTSDGVRTLAAAIERAGASLRPVDNLIDAIWTDRPAPPRAPVELYPEAIAGASRADKRRRIAEALTADRLDALVISAPDNLAWLLNLRGGDLPMTPVALGFAIVRGDATVAVFMDGAKLPPEVRAALAAEAKSEGKSDGDGAGAPAAVTLAEPAALAGALAGLAGRRVRVDHATGSDWIVRTLRAAGATPDVGADPCTLAKACKTAAELAAIRAAHVRDGVAVVRLLAWLAGITPADETEWTVALRAAALRAEGEHHRGPSFRTIAGAGPNGALPHYALHEATARRLADDDVLLIDSGAQYLDGTTDVTRTVILGLGLPTPEIRRRYTQVLQGHLALGNARFPDDTTGAQLDLLARQPLWADGVDYDHGTGHGVGCFLAVHEGPHGIAKRPNAIALRPGMILSNEPGYYKAGAYGIRIENLVVVAKLDPQPAGAEHTTLGFETLTLAPYDRRLIDVALLAPGERATVDAYHARVRDTLTPLLDRSSDPAFDPAAAAFLAAATAPL
ncbi:MAG TPA: aminopeptidase P family protein [Kofleriaceae bacterium]|nr:aminopeptidase P family protein [Kofleriaceae bacterium]